MAFIFKPTSKEAAEIARPHARRLAAALRGRKGKRSSVVGGFLLHAVGDGKNVTVHVVEAPTLLGFLVAGGTAVNPYDASATGLVEHMLDAVQALPIPTKTLCHPPDGFEPVVLAPKRSGTQRNYLTINERPFVEGDFDAYRDSDIISRQFRTFITPQALLNVCLKYRYPGYNNPWRQPLLVVSRLNASAAKSSVPHGGTRASLLSEAHYLEIDLHGLGIESQDMEEVYGAAEWGKMDGAVMVGSSFHHLIRYTTEVVPPPSGSTEPPKIVGRILWRHHFYNLYSPVGPVALGGGDAEADTSLYFFATEGPTTADWVRTYRSKMLRVSPEGAMSELFATEYSLDTSTLPHTETGEPNWFLHAFPVVTQASGAEPAPESEPGARFLVVRHVHREQSEAPSGSFRLTSYAVTGAALEIDIPGMYPVNSLYGALQGGALYPPTRQRSPICQYAPDLAAVLVSPQRATLPTSTDLLSTHLAVVNVRTGAVLSVSGSLLQHYPRDGLTLTTIEQAEVVDGVITRPAKMLLTRVAISGTANYQPFRKPLRGSEVYIIDGLAGAVLVATCPHPISAYYLGTALRPAKIGQSTGLRGLLVPPDDPQG